MKAAVHCFLLPVHLQAGIAACGVTQLRLRVEFFSLILSGDILTNNVPKVCFHGDSKSSLVDSEDEPSQCCSTEYSRQVIYDKQFVGPGGWKDGSLNVAPSGVFLS